MTPEEREQQTQLKGMIERVKEQEKLHEADDDFDGFEN